MKTTISSIVLALLVPAGFGQGFDQEQNLASRSATRAYFVDLDGDGVVDFLADGSSPGWRRNEGGGIFSGRRPIDPGVLPGSAGLAPLDAADLDGDGDNDIVMLRAVNQPGGTRFSVAWYPNRGGGIFGDRRDVTEGGDRVLVARGVDLDGDGFRDILVVRDPYEVSWIRNLGMGQVNGTTFGPEVPITGPGLNIWNADAADIDGDGDLDVVSVSRTFGRVFVSRNLGGGVFAPVEQQGARTNNDGSFDLVDMDLDGDADVLIGDSAGTGMFWHVNDGGAFATKRLVGATGPWPSGVHGGDIDGDGDVDIIYGAVDPSAGVRWFERTGPVTFAPRAPLFPEPYVILDSELGCADIDGDGVLDPFAADSDVRWASSGDGTSPWSARTIGYVQGVPGGACPLDYDGNGVVDVAVTDSRGARVLVNRGDGIFDEILAIDLGFESVSPPYAVDVDGDGDEDLITSKGQIDGLQSVFVHENLGGGSFAPRRVLDVGSGTLADPEVTPADLDGDGDVDLYVNYPDAGRWLENDGFGNYSPMASGVQVPSVAAAGDIDGDGLAELLAIRSSGTFQDPTNCTIVVHEVAANGAVGGPSTLLQFTAGCPPFQGLALEDMNGDGVLDILHYNPDAQTIDLAPGVGGGGFDPSIVLAAALSEVTGLYVLDVDLDGRLDVIARGLFEGHWHRGLPGPLLEVGRSYEETGAGGSRVPLYPVDLDGDGDLDLVKSNGVPVIQLNDTRLGALGCPAGAPNSTGQPGEIFATGSPLFIANDLTLRAAGLPTGQFGIFLTALAPAAITGLGGGPGTLCLDPASIGRFSRGPSEILSTGTLGEVELAIDLGDLPSPFGSLSAQLGETRHFQFWHRDGGASAPSNLTGSLLVRLR